MKEQVEKVIKEIIERQTNKLIGLLIDKRYYNNYLERYNIEQMRKNLEDINDKLSRARFNKADMIKNKNIETDEYKENEKAIELLDSEKQDIGQKINGYMEMQSENMKNEVLIPEVKNHINLVKDLSNTDVEISKLVDELS